jgi:hypothetical protein
MSGNRGPEPLFVALNCVAVVETTDGHEWTRIRRLMATNAEMPLALTVRWFNGGKPRAGLHPFSIRVH